MMFCPKCGSLMKPAKEKGKRILACSCGYKSTEAPKAEITEKVKETKPIEVIEEEIETKPLVPATCPKCGHDKAYFWSIQTRAADEPETRFFKCEKCKHVWREYQ